MMIIRMLAVCYVRFVRGKNLLSSNTDIDVCARHARVHFMRMAQSRPNRGAIEAQYGAQTGPIENKNHEQ